MIAARTLPVETHADRTADITRMLSVLAAVFCFLSFFPNPAIPLTDTLGLQFNQLLAIGMLPFILLKRPPWLHILVVLVALSLMIISSFATYIFRDAAVFDLYIKFGVVVALSLVVLIPTGYLADRMPLHTFIPPACIAIIIHALASVYQLIGFERGTVPLQGLMNNPSFLLVTEDVEIYSTYVKRPYGFFPEPSAMGASLGPWLVLLIGLLLTGRLRSQMQFRNRMLMIVAILAGVFLMFAARSGYSALWLASLAPVLGYYGLVKSRAGMSRMARYVFGSQLAVVCVVLGWTYITGTLDGEEVSSNDSWESRRQSIVISFTSTLRDPLHFIFGFGPGQAPTYLLGNLTRNLLPYWYKTDEILVVGTIWSVIGTYYMETGFIGALGILLLFGLILRSVLRSDARVLGCSVFLAWFFGAMIATSYFPLSPMWLVVGMLLVWDRLFPIAAPEESALAHP